MQFPYVISIWFGSLVDATAMINEWRFADHVIQFIETPQPKGYWLMLRVTGDQRKALIDHGSVQRPRWSIV